MPALAHSRGHGRAPRDKWESFVTLAPLLAASPAIQIHTAAAFCAFAVGLWQFTRLKGTGSHRTVGWLWFTLMAVVAVSSLFIHELRWWGPWSPIHLLSLYTLAMLPGAVLSARRHRVAAHRHGVVALFGFALVGAGAFTLLPGRLMHAVVFGP